MLMLVLGCACFCAVMANVRIVGFGFRVPSNKLWPFPSWPRRGQLPDLLEGPRSHFDRPMDLTTLYYLT